MNPFELDLLIGGVLGIFLTLFAEGLIHIYLIDRKEQSYDLSSTSSSNLADHR